VDATWIVPPAVLLAGAGATAVLLRRLGEAVQDLEGARRRSRRLEDALIPVRVETRRARDSIARLRRR